MSGRRALPCMQLSAGEPLVCAALWAQCCLELCSLTSVIVAVLAKWFLRCCNYFMKEF